MLRERGLDLFGAEVDSYTWFDGHLTTETYETHTDRVLLQFCYRQETFSARNIQIMYKAVDPTDNTGFNAGPWPVYVLSVMVVIFLIAIFVVRFSPWVKPCLDPPSPKHKHIAL